MSFDSSLFVRLGPAAGPALLIKVTLLLAVGAGVAQLLHRRSAAARHFAWLLTLIGVLGITALAALPRGMSVAVPRWPQWASAGDAARPADTPRVAASDAPAHWPMVASDGGGGARVAREPDPGARLLDFAKLGAMLTRLWFAGTCLVLAWLALGHLGLARISARSEPLGDPAWRAQLDRLAREIGVAREVRLRLSREVGAPVVCGLFRPSILLPADAGSWGFERRRVVLLHELAHVARRDPLAQSIAWLACAIYWFHPVAWLAARRLRAECERACDDRVLSSGVQAPDYASHLLSLARRARALRLAGAVSVAMARRSTLEGRLLALLDEGVRRGALTARARGAGIAALAAVLLAVGLVRPVPPAAAGASGEPRSASEPALASAAAEGEVRAAVTPAAAETAKAPAAEEAEPGAKPFNVEQEAKPGETLVLNLKSGATLTILGWDERRVEVRGFLGGPDAQWQSTSFDREGSRHVLRVTPTRNTGSFSTSNRFTIHVPRRFDVRISSAGGKVTIADVEGSFEGSSGGGGLAIERARGRVSLSTGGGDIRVKDCDLSGTVSTGGGMVLLSRVRGGLKGTSGSGPVIYSEAPAGASGDLGDLGDLENLGDVEFDGTITIGGAASGGSKGKPSGEWPAGMLHVEKAGGDIRMPEAPNGVSASTGGGDVTIGRAGGMVDASTGGGDIEIGPAAGSVRASTGAGDVHVILAKGNTRRMVDVTSGHGGVVIEMPRGLKIDLDLETAYTHSSHPARIRSDVPIKIEPATDWDDREGTPRRYVRARSTGSGGALVRIKAVNGDIEIRTTSGSI